MEYVNIGRKKLKAVLRYSSLIYVAVFFSGHFYLFTMEYTRVQWCWLKYNGFHTKSISTIYFTLLALLDISFLFLFLFICFFHLMWDIWCLLSFPFIVIYPQDWVSVKRKCEMWCFFQLVGENFHLLLHIFRFISASLIL